MKMTSQAVLFGIECSKGEFENTKYDSTKFHLSVDMAQKSNGKSLGIVTRPFKFGDSTEFQKWEHLADLMGRGRGVPVECDFDVVASADGVKLTLLAIKTASTASAKGAAAQA